MVPPVDKFWKSRETIESFHALGQSTDIGTLIPEIDIRPPINSYELTPT